MLLTVISWWLLAQPVQKCVTVNGTRSCGYECIDNGERAQCTQSPTGVCAKNSQTVVCFDPPTWLQAAWGAGPLPKPSCESVGASIACGYDCKREGLKVACAQTPKGVCTREYGMLLCFDPPPEVYGIFGHAIPAPICKAQDGQVACGYKCVAGSGQLACAKTPFGVCAEAGGAPSCFDPDKIVICAKGKATPAAECIAQSGRLWCGYHCARAGIEVACAQTPDGTCDTGGPGKPVCFDPPVRGGSAACLETLSAKTF